MRRSIGVAVMLTAAVAFAGCASGPDPGTDSLDSRLAWPCNRLVVAWAIDVAQLQELVGENVTVRNDNGAGQLQLSIMRCDPPPTARRRAKPLQFAYLMVPVVADSVPLVITSVPKDGWLSLVHLVADANSQALFSRLGYDALTAEMSIALGETGVEARLTFDSGHIAMVARVAATPVTLDVNRALLSTGIGYVSAFFGHETAERYRSVSATVRIEGETPLSKLDVSQTPALTVFDQGLSSDRIFWRLPVAQQ